MTGGTLPEQTVQEWSVATAKSRSTGEPLVVLYLRTSSYDTGDVLSFPLVMPLAEAHDMVDLFPPRPKPVSAWKPQEKPRPFWKLLLGRY